MTSMSLTAPHRRLHASLWSGVFNNPLTTNTACKHLCGSGSILRMCCKFVVEAKVWADDRKFSSSQRTDRE